MIGPVMRKFCSLKLFPKAYRPSVRSLHNNVSEIPQEKATDKTMSFAMSGCGWLTPFYFGVISKMREEGYLTKNSLVAGTSGGSLGALVAVCDVEPLTALKIISDMARDRSFKKNIDLGLKEVLPSLLNEHSLQKCNANLNVCVTKLWPNPKGSPHIINKYQNHEEIVDVVAASCFIPL